ncbi:MAG: hypothetical protein HY695_25080 [Deltaproteobacteria bacterium]|nr:hypothetical protein [Deltaproteobacteria bacterium]
MTEVQNPRSFGDDEVNLVDYWRVIWKRRRWITVLFSTSVIAALVFSIFSPKIYESTATILTPKEGAIGGGLLTTLAASGAAQQLTGLSVPSLTPNRDIFMGVLKSRTIAQNVVEQLKLRDYYKAQNLEDAIKEAQGATEISISREGVISVKVEDKDPKLAAQIANAYMEHLDRLVSQFGTGTAGRQRRFIAEQLEKTQKDLVAAEDNLKRFQEKNRAVSIGAQAQGAIEVAARLKGEIVASEVQLQVMRGFATDFNPEVMRLTGKIGELKRQLAQAQYGAGLDLPAVTNNPGHPQKELFVTPARVPQVGLQLARLTRDVKVQETVYTLLTQQLEQAKIAEAQDTPVVQVLDRAVPAIRKSKPKTTLNMALAGAMSLFFGVFLAFCFEYVEKQRSKQSMVIGQ